jgi:SAM-dependent methyltransferase
MSAVQHAVAEDRPDGRVLFEREWATYRRLVDNNYLFHREAYDRLRQVLLADRPAPFRFLDIACGDAGESVRALAGTAVSSYCGIDLCGPALELAQLNLTTLGCPVQLCQGDLQPVLSRWRSPIDVAWIGLSLHHFRTPGKLRILRSIRKILSSLGLLIIYENASPNDEDRASWLDRWDCQRPTWIEYSDDEWKAVKEHVHGSDFPETGWRWLELGREAGFAEMREIYRAPTDLFRMYLLEK